MAAGKTATYQLKIILSFFLSKHHPKIGKTANAGNLPSMVHYRTLQKTLERAFIFVNAPRAHELLATNPRIASERVPKSVHNSTE